MKKAKFSFVIGFAFLVTVLYCPDGYSQSPQNVPSEVEVMPDGFPTFINTGNPEVDQSDYQKAKEDWIASHPDAYKAMSGEGGKNGVSGQKSDQANVHLADQTPERQAFIKAHPEMFSVDKDGTIHMKGEATSVAEDSRTTEKSASKAYQPKLKTEQLPAQAKNALDINNPAVRARVENELFQPNQTAQKQANHVASAGNQTHDLDNPLVKERVENQLRNGNQTHSPTPYQARIATRDLPAQYQATADIENPEVRERIENQIFSGKSVSSNVSEKLVDAGRATLTQTFTQRLSENQIPAQYKRGVDFENPAVRNRIETDILNGKGIQPAQNKAETPDLQVAAVRERLEKSTNQPTSGYTPRLDTRQIPKELQQASDINVPAVRERIENSVLNQYNTNQGKGSK
ncbi:MAG: hypothetical protein H6581_17840 [Bacteroidia bacterium]|nr:hypothetical protein [Bacteroidia bacterium]